jgi:hypothetical protein
METGQVATSDFLPRFAAALNESFGQPVDNAVSAINRLRSAWDLWKQDLFSGGGARGLSVISDSLNESSAAMRRLGNEAGVTHRALVALAGAFAGAVGASHFDIAGRQRTMLQSTLPGAAPADRRTRRQEVGEPFRRAERDRCRSARRFEPAVSRGGPRDEHRSGRSCPASFPDSRTRI